MFDILSCHVNYSPNKLIKKKERLKSLGIKESQKNNDNTEGCVKEIPGRMWGFALYKEAINSDPGVTGMDLLYLPPPLPPANTYIPQRFQSRLYILTYFWGVGAQFLWGLPVFMNRKEYQKSPFIFRDQPQPVRRLVTQDAQWEDVCPDGSARQGGLEVCVVDDLCLLQADFNVGPAVDWSPSGLGSGELGGCGWHGHLIFSLNVGASWAKYL